MKFFCLKLKLRLNQRHLALRLFHLWAPINHPIDGCSYHLDYIHCIRCLVYYFSYIVQHLSDMVSLTFNTRTIISIVLAMEPGQLYSVQ